MLRLVASRRCRSRLASLWSLALLAGLTLSTASAQLPQTRLYSVYPPGGQRGTTVEVTLANGVDLDDVKALVFSHPAIKAAPKLAEGTQQPVANTFLVTIDPSVPVGMYDVRASGKYGVSNPRTFVVGDLVELNETEPNNQLAQAVVIEINKTVNGKANAGTDIDLYKVAGKARQRVLIEAAASQIDSKMDVVLEVVSPLGKLLASNRNYARRDPLIDITFPADGEYVVRVYDFLYGGSPDHQYRLSVHTLPHIDFILPASGLANTTAEYTLYGRNLPGGQPSPFKMNGATLDMVKLPIQLPADPSAQIGPHSITSQEAGVDSFGVSVKGPSGSSNVVPLYYASTTPLVEVEPNDAAAQAQKITVPCEITGQFQARGDADVFQFTAKAQEVFWMEVFGQRSSSNADPVLIVERVTVDDKGVETVARITAVDDIATQLLPTLPTAFDTRNDDAEFRFVAPAEGTYRVTVRDRYFESRGNPLLTYRLSIRPETPDFRVVALPIAPNPQNNVAQTWDFVLRRGDNLPIDVLAFRRDGFNGVIDVTVEGLPPGVTCTGSSIGPGQNATTLVFTSTEQAELAAANIRILAKARIDSPSAVAATAAAEAAVKAAVMAQPPLDKAAADMAAAQKVADDKAAAAQKAFDDKKDDKNLEKAAADAKAAAVKAAETAKAALDAKTAGDKKIADAQAAVIAAKAAENAAAQNVTRMVRGGTIVWGGGQNAAPGQSRVSRNLTLSVIAETAPIQITAETPRVEVNQSSQILVPVKVLKRNGFDEAVNLTFVGQPQNIQLENKPIAKGKDAEVYRLFVQNNAAPGTYTIYLKGQAQVQYRRNPEAADAAAKEKEAADKAAVDAAEALKKATEAKTAAEKKFTDATAAAKKATDDKAAADKAAADTEAAAKAAADKAAAEKKAAETDAGKKAAADEAEKAAATAAEAAKKAAEAKTAAEKVLTDANAALKTATDEKAVADKGAVDADTANKAAIAAKAAAEKKATDTANVAKPTNVQYFQPSPALVVTVKPGTANLTVAPANNGQLKRGDKVEVKCTVARINGFAGPVTLSLPLPVGVTGLSAAPVEIPADMNEGTLVIQAAGDATEGQLANLVVRASMSFNGAPAAVDQPLALKVNP